MIWRVKRVGVGSECDIDSFFFAECEIFLEGLRVRTEILGAVELERVDEDGDGDSSFWTNFFPCRAKEGKVAFV